MASWFDIKLRAILGDEPQDDKEVTEVRIVMDLEKNNKMTKSAGRRLTRTFSILVIIRNLCQVKISLMSRSLLKNRRKLKYILFHLSF